MRLYHFKTFSRSYYFPEIKNSQQYLYGLYSPWGGLLPKLYWLLFRKFRFVRKLMELDSTQVDFPFQMIMDADGTDCVMSFNMGAPDCQERKISILGYDNKTSGRFFAKFSQFDQAKRLTLHEADIYHLLQGTGLVPRIMRLIETPDYVYLKTEYITGSRPTGLILTKKIVDLSLLLKSYSIDGIPPTNCKTLTCLSHGDFCPWNMLEQNDQIRLIDWEMAADRPLGYDIFTFITQVSLLFHQDKTLTEAINENLEQINYYFSNFSIDNWEPYLHDFAIKRKEYEIGKGNVQHSKKYECIINYKK